MTKRQADEEVKNITRQLVEKYRPEKIILFGSAARGEEEINDLDLLIIKKDVPENGMDRSRELHRLMNYHVAMDFFVMKPAEFDRRAALRDPFILQSVMGEGRVLYGG